MAAQVPDNDVVHVFALKAQRLIDLHKAIHTGGGVDFQVDVQDAALPAGESKPGFSFGNRDAQFHQQEGLTSLAAAGDQHLMSAPQYTFDQLLGQGWRVSSKIRQR